MRKIFLILLSFILIFIDFLSKWFFSGYFQSKILDCFPITNDCLYKYFPIFWEYFWFQLSHNNGVAFSLPITGLPLQIITVILVIGILYQYLREEYQKKSLLLDIGFIFIISWALSHAYERIFIGHVVDFIAVKYFAILNFADIFISVWVFLIVCFYVFFQEPRRK